MPSNAYLQSKDKHTTDDEINFIDGLGTYTEKGKILRVTNLSRWLKYRRGLLESYVSIAHYKDWNGVDQDLCVQYALDKIQEVSDCGG